MRRLTSAVNVVVNAPDPVAADTFNNGTSIRFLQVENIDVNNDPDTVFNNGTD